MESIIPVLIAIGFLILQVVTAGNKKKPTAGRPPFGSQPADTLPPVNVPQNPLERWLESIQMEEQQAVPERVKENNPEMDKYNDKHTEATLYPTATTPNTPLSATGQQHFQPAVTTPPLEVVRSKEEEEAFAEPSVTPSCFLLDADSFDARQAIVYSEIMRPKFEE